MNHVKLFCLVFGMLLIISCSMMAEPIPLTATPMPPTATPLPPTETPLPPPNNTDEAFLGIWDVCEYYIQFNEDGIYKIAAGKSALENNPIRVGDYEVDGSHLKITAREGPCQDITGEYELEFTNNGENMTPLLDEDSCKDRVEMWASCSPFTRQIE